MNCNYVVTFKLFGNSEPVHQLFSYVNEAERFYYDILFNMKGLDYCGLFLCAEMQFFKEDLRNES